MYPVIQMPDTELWATVFLRAALADPSIRVDNKVPHPLPAQLVVVRDDGGPRNDFLHRTAVMVFNVYAPTEQAVTNLANRVEALLLSVRAVSPVEYTRSLSAPVRVEDVRPRRYFTIELVVRGEEI
jgi:hypothetical protein